MNAAGCAHSGRAAEPTGFRRANSAYQTSGGGPCSSKLPHKCTGIERRASAAEGTMSMKTGMKRGAFIGATRGCSMRPDLKSVARQWWSESCEDRWKCPCISGEDASIDRSRTWTMASHTKGTQTRRMWCRTWLLVMATGCLAHTWQLGKYYFLVHLIGPRKWAGSESLPPMDWRMKK